MIEMTETPKAAQPENASPMFSGVAPGCARPILFSGPMVSAILAGDKTQTRRICKPAMREYDALPTAIHQDGSGAGWIAWYGQNPPGAEETVKFYPGGEGFKCPYGLPGDHLWVRETWKAYDRREMPPNFFYRASEPDAWPHLRWRPSIHMPRLASRILLEITNVRVERLQQISDTDALGEGVDRTNTSIKWYAIERFTRLWVQTYGIKSWDDNPWVWAVSFRVV